MSKRDKLEPLADGWVGFHTESGDHWKHRDVNEAGSAGTAHYRVFVSDRGEQRRYSFSRKDPRDSTVWDLREQLRRSEESVAATASR
ncbi:MAG TPA: hypothetical protein VM076_15180 [Gemmatimonadaceae bacterium]|nr:hypothetical protein [Gemmatimonadaceae bacterium]